MRQDDDDRADADQFGLALDLAALVEDVRREHVETLPRDARFALALVLLASAFDEHELAELLAVPDETVEGAGRQLNAEVWRELVLRNLKDLTRNRKDNP